MTRFEIGRGNIVALDVSVRKARPQAAEGRSAAILLFTGVRYQRELGGVQVSPAALERPAGQDERRLEG